MANVRVEQRNAHLAGQVRLEYVNGREGRLAKGVVTAISNARRGSGEERSDEATSIQWTLWGKQAENAAEYLGKGSHVNIVGRIRSNNYEKDGKTIYGMAFSVDEIDYLDSRADAEARRARQRVDGQQGDGHEGEGHEREGHEREGQQAPAAEAAPKPRAAKPAAGSYAQAGKRAA